MSSEIGEDFAFRTLHLHTAPIKREREAGERAFRREDEALRNLKYYSRNKFSIEKVGEISQN